MRIALEVEDVLADEIRGGEGGLDVAELEGYRLVDVRRVAVLVDAHLRMRERVLDGHERAQRLVVHLDELGGALRRLLVHRGYRRHRIPHHAHLVHAQGFLVLGDGEDAELDAREIVAGDDGVDAGQRRRAGGVDPPDPRVRVRAPEQLAEGHPREDQVVRELGVARHLGPGVDLGQGLPDHGEALGHVRASFLAGPVRAPLMRRAASSTASRILV